MATFAELAALDEPPVLIELYRIIDAGGEALYLASGRDAINFDGKIYQPGAGLTRTPIKVSDDIGTHSCQITVPLNKILANYITQSYIRATISIFMMFLGYPETVTPLFHGIIPGGVDLNLDTKTVSALCISPNEGLLECNVPRVRYMPYCQNVVYSPACGVKKSTYRRTATITAIEGTSLKATAFSSANPRLTYGMAVFGAESRDIVYHNGDEIRVSIPFTAALTVGSKIDVYPGCGGVNCLSGGRPNFTKGIPSHNPVMWGI